MALTYDATKTALHWDDQTEEQRQLTIDLPWLMLACGIQRITADNVRELYFRMNFWADLNNNYAYRLSMQDLKDRIGIRTNISAETRAQWLKRISTGYDRELSYRLSKTN